jgi:hypothetical protein
MSVANFKAELQRQALRTTGGSKDLILSKEEKLISKKISVRKKKKKS